MEKIILGLLMLRSMTIYEIKNTLKAKLGSMCSDSTGSIHTAIRLLMQKGYINFQEDGRRKIYFITSKGRESFTSWIAEPMNHEKAKNIEASKVFFMGLLPQNNVEPVINEYLNHLKMELGFLNTLMTLSTSDEKRMKQESQRIIQEDPYNEEGIKNHHDDRSIEQTISDIYNYQIEILQYAIDSIQFEIQWYQAFLQRNHS